ncbi:MAG: hypothetical protein V1835_05630 [Candidatus Micrarchaeota archaeon]
MWKRGLKAQSGVELLIILAAGIVVLGFAVYASQQRIGDSQAALAFSIAKGSAIDLANAADSVYIEGVGSKRRVSVTLPEGTLLTKISQNSINIRVAAQGGASDASANTKAKLCPNSLMPNKPGKYSITVESLDDCVAVGALSNLTVSTTLISVSTKPDTAFTRSVNYTNIGANPILVNLELGFASSGVTVAFANLGDRIFTLNAGENKEIVLDISASASALGSYSGSLKANGSSGDNLTTSIVISVYPEGCSPSVCPPSAGGSNVSMIEINTYSSSSYTQQKDIFDPGEQILFQGADWDPGTQLTLDVRDPADAFSLPGYPKELLTNSTGGFNDTMLSGGIDVAIGYIVRATGAAGGKTKITTDNFGITVCT